MKTQFKHLCWLPLVFVPPLILILADKIFDGGKTPAPLGTWLLFFYIAICAICSFVGSLGVARLFGLKEFWKIAWVLVLSIVFFCISFVLVVLADIQIHGINC